MEKTIRTAVSQLKRELDAMADKAIAEIQQADEGDAKMTAFCKWGSYIMAISNVLDTAGVFCAKAKEDDIPWNS